MTEPSLFDTDLRIPPIVMAGDSARARRSDPEFSHRAADKSAETRSAVERAVLLLVRQETSIGGRSLNELYRARAIRMNDQVEWPMVAWDSPRKRAGELAAKGALVVTNADAPRGTEAEYALPTEAREVAA